MGVVIPTNPLGKLLVTLSDRS